MKLPESHDMSQPQCSWAVKKDVYAVPTWRCSVIDLIIVM